MGALDTIKNVFWRFVRIILLFLVVCALLWLLFSIFIGHNTSEATKTVEEFLHHVAEEQYDKAKALYVNQALVTHTPDGYFDDIAEQLDLESPYKIQWQSTSLQQVSEGTLLEVRGEVSHSEGRLSFIASRLKKGKERWLIDSFQIRGSGETSLDRQ